jgi:uncharacterized protein (TIGR01777 family)
MQSTSAQNDFTVLITGGGGLIGKYVTSALVGSNYKVIHLSRNPSFSQNVKAYRWDPENQIIDSDLNENIDYVIHLAGANIGEKKWSAGRKKEIVGSRVNSLKFLYKILRERNIRLKAFITASGINYYGTTTSERVFSESDPSGDDFLASTCKQWEDAADLFQNDGIRTVKIRTGLVLERQNTTFKKFIIPARFGIFPIIGSGEQYISWIHIKDICSIYLETLENNNFEGAYNAVAPEFLNYRDFIKILARVMKRPFINISVPYTALRIFMGEMSDLAAKGSRISSKKLINAGFRFSFGNLNDALTDLLSKQ